MNKYMERIHNGIVKENPVFIMMLGMCPTLAVTTSATNGFGMGVSTLAVLVMSNLVISLLRKIIPDQVRLPAYIVVVASLVTVVQMLIEGFLPALNSALGIYIPLIVVNCIILGRAEAFAAKNPPLLSVFDGLGMGLGFTVALVIIGLVRELLGAGTAFGVQVMPSFYQPISILTSAPGAFLVLGVIVAIMNGANISTAANDKVEGCDGCCASCSQSCGSKKEDKEANV
jgi:electron transport complex protein RnfE